MRRMVAVAVVAAAVCGYVKARRWFTTWGATPEEQGARLPGDELLPQPSMVTTRAITIDAPPDAVWPWLVQMGQGRGGFYSYDWLENVFDLDIHNADRIEPAWQELAVGDQLRAAPASSGPAAGFTVVDVDPGRSLVTVVGDPAVVLPQAEAGTLTDGGTWAFVLQPEGERQTRLIVRLRARFPLPPAGSWVVERLLEPVHFVMERQQLLGIRERAGRQPSPADAPVSSRRSVVAAG
jgi:hypothetical protein